MGSIVSTPNANKQKSKHTKNIIPSQLINSLNQTQINQHYIDKVVAENQQVSKPLTIIITPSSNALCGVKQDVCLLCYTIHADIKIGVTNIIKHRFDYHKHGGLIVILVSIISGEFYYDQNQQPRHIEKLQKDIIHRLPENTAVIWDYSKCQILNIEPLSPFIKYRNAPCNAPCRETFNINKETKPEQLQLTNCQHIDDANNLGSNSQETEPDDITLSNVDDDEEKYNKNSCKISTDIEYVTYQQYYSAVNISRKLSDSILPNKIKQTIPNLYHFMIKSISLHKNNVFNTQNGIIMIFDYGFNDATTNQILYLVAIPYKKQNYEWKIIDTLFTPNDIKNQYNIRVDTLPNLLRVQFVTQLMHKEDVKHFLKNEKNVRNIIDRTKWGKIPIYNKKSNNKRITLSLTKCEFIQQLKRLENNADIIPIIMPVSDKSGSYHGRHYQVHTVEFVQIWRITPDLQVGIAYIYVNENCVAVKGIHLNKCFVQSQHQLILPGHKCRVLETWRSNIKIDHLLIGDPDKHKNNSNRFKKQCQEQKRCMEDLTVYLQKMNSNAANLTQENVQRIYKRLNASKQTVDCSLDLSSLLGADERPDHDSYYKSPLPVAEVMQINNFYFQQTLNPNPKPIIAHPIHKQTHAN